MPKVIRGTKDLKGNLILKGGQGGMRKIRCQSCQGTATEQVLSDGKTAYVCACGALYGSTPLR